nr:glycosyltransferase [uncultured Rhodopila sp.]
MSHEIAESLDSAEKQLRPSIVAIPARDEAERIEACLTALSDQQHCPDAVVLLLNNCTDATEAIARGLAPRLRYRLDIVNRELPPRQANAGWARRLAMQLAAAQAGPGDVLMATDADTVVPPDWVVRNLAALGRGADVVCGRVVVDPWEAAMIPAHLHADDALECRLIGLLDDIAWMLDPEPHDPPPRHTEASGASLAVSVEAYHRVGGIPAIPCGEDRAFVASLWRMDARVRHDPGIKVVVSGRIEGRAEGGMADAIRRRMVQQDEHADDQAEPAEDALRRYSLRSRVRQAWSSRRGDSGLAAELDVPASLVAGAVSGPYFGAAWAELERLSPVLRRRRVRFTELSREIALAEEVLRQLTPAEAMAAD